jgi:hypothetical protein
VHGSIHRLQCLAGCGAPVWSADGTDVAVDPATMRARPPLPTCPRCDALARPNIMALPTIRRQAELASAATGALVRINVREPQVRDGRAVGIPAPAGQVLTALDELLR